MIRWLFLLVMISAFQAQARVFNINRNMFAPYFLFSGGGSMLKNDAVDDQGVTGVTTSGIVGYNYSTEFGTIISRPAASLRIGLEVLKPTILSANVNNGSILLYTAKSELLAYIPKVGFEVNLQSEQVYRSFMSLVGGYATLDLSNTYDLTAAGQAAYSGIVDHVVEANSAAVLANASMGYEGWMDDNTTVLFEFGYRQLKFDNIKYSKDVSTFSGSKLKGDKVLNSASTSKTLDLSGGYVSIGFRFYF